MTGERILEDDRVLALDYEPGYVEGPEIDPSIHAGRKVAATAEMFQASRNIHHQVAVNEDL